MTNEKRLEELGEIAITTINEFFNEMEFIGWDPIKDIIYDKVEQKIYVKYDELEEEYDLENISGIISSELEGIGPCGPSFYEGIDLRESELEEDYGEIEDEKKTDYTYIVKDKYVQDKRKKEFMKYAGKLMYVKYRAPEVLNILRAIEKEAKKLILRDKKSNGFSTNLGMLLEDL